MNYAILTEQRNARPGILHLIVIEINAIWVRLIYIRYIHNIEYIKLNMPELKTTIFNFFSKFTTHV